jgi:hypothetical protein
MAETAVRRVQSLGTINKSLDETRRNLHDELELDAPDPDTTYGGENTV